MNDEDRGQRGASPGRQGEVLAVIGVAEKTFGICNQFISILTRKGFGYKAQGQRKCLPVAYPTCMLVHLLPGSQYPNAPKSTFLNVASGMAFIIGVDKTESKRRTKAMELRIARGVAGRSMPAVPYLRTAVPDVEMLKTFS